MIVAFDLANPEAAVVRGTVEAASINTNNEKRDKHLRSSDFFDTEKHPKLHFESTKATITQGRNGKIAGNLTIHGVTRAVVLEPGQRVASRAAGASSRPGSKIDTQQPMQDVTPIGARRAVSGGPGVAADDELFLERLQSGEDAAFEASGPSSTSEGCQPRGMLQANNTVEISPTGEQAPRA